MTAIVTRRAAAPLATPRVTTATTDDADRAIAVLTLAFSTDPVARWIWPDPHTYLRSLPAFAHAIAGRAFDDGTAYVAGAFAGVALWLGPGAHPDDEAVTGVLERTVAEADKSDMSALMVQMGTYHPTEPHWYLPMIGIQTRLQGQGYGSALLSHALARADRDGLPAYLESSNEVNIPLYRRHGFEVIGVIQAGASPAIYPMLRLPR